EVTDRRARDLDEIDLNSHPPEAGVMAAHVCGEKFACRATMPFTELVKVLVDEDCNLRYRWFAINEQRRCCVERPGDAHGFFNAIAGLFGAVHQAEAVVLVPEVFSTVIPEADALHADRKAGQYPSVDVLGGRRPTEMQEPADRAALELSTPERTAPSSGGAYEFVAEHHCVPQFVQLGLLGRFHARRVVVPLV